MERGRFVAELEARMSETRKFIQVVAGSRQVGKTTIINQFLILSRTLQCQVTLFHSIYRTLFLPVSLKNDINNHLYQNNYKLSLVFFQFKSHYSTINAAYRQSLAHVIFFRFNFLFLFQSSLQNQDITSLLHLFLCNFRIPAEFRLSMHGHFLCRKWRLHFGLHQFHNRRLYPYIF